jgi:CHAT domain-containing protein
MVLYEMIQARQAREFADLPAEASEREAALRTDLNHLTELIFDWEHSSRPVDSTELAQLKTQLFSQQQAHDSLLNVLEQAYPGYSQLKQTQAIVNPQLIQARLKEDEAFLSYVSQDSVLGVFVFTQDGFDYVSLPMGGHLAADIQAYRTALQSPSMAYDVFSPLSYQLYQLLVAPVSQLIEGKRLIISPDGRLATIPFESLITEPNSAGASYAAAPFLIKKHQLSYTYSATFWVEEQTQLAPNRETLAFAPSFNERRNDSPSEENLLALASTDTIRGKLSGLRGTRKEVEEMSQFLSVTSFIEGQATESAFKALAGGYGILHLATHAIIDNENPLNSRLLFSIGQDSSEDGDLHAWELYQLDLHAQLAVLSACNTGFGKLQRGEGVMSLGRAFAYAGVPSVVMSLWPAEDESTADLMGSFYQKLAAGRSKDEALQAAKLQFLKEADPIAHHPFYWAGFVVQGEAGPLADKQQNGWWWLLGLALLVLIGGVAVYRRRSSLP